MPPIEVGSTNPLGAAQARFSRAGSTTGAATSLSAPSLSAWSESPTVDASAGLDPGAVPIDLDRVALIRKALENGTYPVIPTQIADAMIAAGVLLRSHHE